MIQKTFHTGGFLLLLVLFSSFWTDNQVSEEIRTAFIQGDARGLASFFGERLELELEGQRAAYSQTQAVYILKDFFEEYPPKSFEYSQQKNFSQGRHYLVARYQSLRGPFKIAIMIQEVQGSPAIFSLDILRE